jgi:hypothetical protein
MRATGEGAATARTACPSRSPPSSPSRNAPRSLSRSSVAGLGARHSASAGEPVAADRPADSVPRIPSPCEPHVVGSHWGEGEGPIFRTVLCPSNANGRRARLCRAEPQVTHGQTRWTQHADLDAGLQRPGALPFMGEWSGFHPVPGQMARVPARSQVIVGLR